MISQIFADSILTYSATECMISDSIKAMAFRPQIVDLIPNKALVSVANESYILRHNLPMDLWQHNSFFFGEKEALSLELADPITNQLSLFKTLFKKNGVFYSASREIGLSKCTTDLAFTPLLIGNALKIGALGLAVNLGLSYLMGEKIDYKDFLLAGAFALLPEVLILL